MKWFTHTHKHDKLRRVVVNVFGTVGYLSVVVASALALGVVAITILVSLYGTVAVIPQETIDSSTGQSVGPDVGASGFGRVFSFFITGIMAAVTLVAIAMLPYWINKFGQRCVGWIVRTTKAPDTLKVHYFIKVAFGLVPLLALLVCLPFSQLNELYAIIVTSGILALVAATCFSLQTILAVVWRLPAERVH